MESEKNTTKKEMISHYISLIKNASLRHAVMKYYIANRDEIDTLPASAHFHHVYTGGLYDHIIEVIRIGLSISYVCPASINHDHYIAAAVLHDFGKIGAYTYNKEKGKWEGSITRGRQPHELKPILDFAASAGNPLPMEVQEAILGHMGGWSTSGCYPDTMLGAVLHSADLISSRIGHKK